MAIEDEIGTRGTSESANTSGITAATEEYRLSKAALEVEAKAETSKAYQFLTGRWNLRMGTDAMPLEDEVYDSFATLIGAERAEAKGEGFESGARIADTFLKSCPWCGVDRTDTSAIADFHHLIGCGDREIADLRAQGPPE